MSNPVDMNLQTRTHTHEAIESASAPGTEGLISECAIFLRERLQITGHDSANRMTEPAPHGTHRDTCLFARWEKAFSRPYFQASLDMIPVLLLCGCIL